MRARLGDEGLPVVITPDQPSTGGGATIAGEGVPRFLTEGRVTNGDLFARGNRPPRHQIQAREPGVGIARMVKRFPLLRVMAPHHINFIGEGVGILIKPLLFLLSQLLEYIALPDQAMGLLVIPF